MENGAREALDVWVNLADEVEIFLSDPGWPATWRGIAQTTRTLCEQERYQLARAHVLSHELDNQISESVGIALSAVIEAADGRIPAARMFIQMLQLDTRYSKLVAGLNSAV